MLSTKIKYMYAKIRENRRANISMQTCMQIDAAKATLQFHGCIFISENRVHPAMQRILPYPSGNKPATQ